MRFPPSTTAAAAFAFIVASFPALAQTSGTPTPAPAPATDQSPAGQLPNVNGQVGGPTREMIRQMVEQAIQEKMQQDRGSQDGYFHEKPNRNQDAEGADEADSRAGRWHDRGDWGRGHRMAGHRGPQMMRAAGMRLIFGLLDTDGDGSLSENEVDGAVGRIFSAIDENGDGKIDLEEIQSFLHGSRAEDMP